MDKRLFFLIIFLGDFMFFYLALFLTLLFRGAERLGLSFQEHFWPFLLLFILYQFIFLLVGLWDNKFIFNIKNIFNIFLPFHFIAIFLMAMIFYLFPVFKIAPKTNLIIFSLASFILIFLWKVFVYKNIKFKKRGAILLGEDEEAEKIFNQKNFWNIKIIQKGNSIDNILLNKECEIILINFKEKESLRKLYKFIKKGIWILDTNKVKEEYFEKINLDLLDEGWFIKRAQKKEKRLDFFLIRLSDILLSIPILLIYFITYVPLAFLIKKDDGPVFVKMPRVGKGGKVFYIKKFRSMSDGKTFINHNKEVTKIGKFIRKTSLDELPQVWSILKGDMSFVGPRPELEELVIQYEKEIKFYDARHFIRPGLSGWAQVKQKNAPHHKKDSELTREKLSYDLFYIKNYSFFLYLKVVFLTLLIVINRKNYN